MNIATALNRKYINYTIVMLTSLCENNPVHVDAYLLHSELIEEDIQYMQDSLSQYDITLLPIAIDKEIFHDKFPRNTWWSLEAYYRLLLLDYLPLSVDRILYLDVDIIINKSLEDYYTADFQTDEIIACIDSCGTVEWNSRSEKQRQMFAPMIEMGYQYFNSGVMLLNVALMRGKYNFDVYLSAIKEWNYEMHAPDQDILNYVHWERIGYIDPYAYDLFALIAHEAHMSYEAVTENAYIVHFSGEKPWNTTCFHYDIEKLWWDYAALTPCYQTLLSDFMHDLFENDILEKNFRGMLNYYEQAASQIEQLKEINQQLIETNRNLVSLLHTSNKAPASHD